MEGAQHERCICLGIYGQDSSSPLTVLVLKIASAFHAGDVCAVYDGRVGCGTEVAAWARSDDLDIDQLSASSLHMPCHGRPSKDDLGTQSALEISKAAPDTYSF